MSELWEVVYYEEVDGTQPVQEFLQDPSLTSGELKQFRVRLYLLSCSSFKPYCQELQNPCSATILVATDTQFKCVTA